MRIRWAFWSVIVVLALFGGATDFRVSRQWFPWATGIAILSPLLTLPLLRRAGLLILVDGSPGDRAKNWIAGYVPLVIASGLIFGCALPALGTALLGSDERAPVRLMAKLQRPNSPDRWIPGIRHKVVMSLGDGNHGTYSVDKETYLKFVTGGGNTYAHMRRSWFGFDVSEIEASRGPGGPTPRLEF